MRTLVDLLESARTQYAERPFLGQRRGGRTTWWTYDETSRRTCQVAHWLAARGIAPGERVGLWAQSQPDWVAIFFGIVRAGGVVVPLDIKSTPEFARDVLARSEAKLIIVDAARSNNAKAVEGELVPFEQVLPQAAAFPETSPTIEVQPDDLAELVFTSGTTGRPKGVMLTHRNLIANVESGYRRLRSQPYWRILSILPLSHLFEQSGGLFSPMLGGSGMVYPASLNPKELFAALQEEHITCISVVPQVLQLFMRKVEQEVKRSGRQRAWSLMNALAAWLPFRVRRKVFSQVHRSLGGGFELFICGGAYLDPALHRKWERLGIKVVQAYGATEAAPALTANSLESRKYGSVGKPIDCVELKIGRDGEIMARGENIFQGYWRDPEKTAEAFEDGWYLTGDLGYFDNEGYLYLHGRKKDMIALGNGMKVYPEDVENALNATDAIKDCVVLGLPGDSGPEVHAVLILDKPDQAREIVRTANRTLAEHQRVRGFTIWPDLDFPRTHTLKVKRTEVLARVQSILQQEEKKSEAAA